MNLFNRNKYKLTNEQLELARLNNIFLHCKDKNEILNWIQKEQELITLKEMQKETLLGIPNKYLYYIIIGIFIIINGIMEG